MKSKSKSRIVTLAVLLITVTLLSGCFGNPPKGRGIKRDLLESDKLLRTMGLKVYDTQIDKRDFKDLEIIKRETDKEYGNDTVHARVTVEHGNAEVIGELRLYYSRQESGKWELRSMRKKGRPTYKPLSGVDKSDIKGDLLTKGGLPILDDGWYLRKSDIKKFKVLKNKSDLDNQTATALVKVSLGNDYIDASGKLKLNYEFKYGDWDIIKVERVGNFKYNKKISYQIGLDQIKEDLIGQKFKFKDDHVEFLNMKTFYWVIGKDEFKEINISDQSIGGSGIYNTLMLDLVLESERSKIEGKLVTVYKYEEKAWKLEHISRANEEDFKFSFFLPTAKHIKDDIVGKRLYYRIDGRRWHWNIDKGDIDRLEIVERKTTDTKDVVYVDIRFVGNKNIIEGQLKINYNKGLYGWNIGEIDNIGKIKQTKI